MDRDTSDARAADPTTEYRDAADPSLAERMAPELLPLLEHPGYRVPDPTATIRLEGPDGADLEVRLAHPAIGQGDLLRMAAEAADHLRIDLEERLKTARCTEVSPTGHRCELPYGHDDTAHEAVKAGRWA